MINSILVYLSLTSRHITALVAPTFRHLTFHPSCTRVYIYTLRVGQPKWLDRPSDHVDIAGISRPGPGPDISDLFRLQVHFM